MSQADRTIHQSRLQLGKQAEVSFQRHTSLKTMNTTKRLGVLIPSSNTSVEIELSRSLPSSVTLHSGRLPLLAGVEPEAVELMVQDIESVSLLLASAGVDLIMLFATVPSLLHGHGFDKKIAERIKAITGIPAITTSTAMLDALQLVGATRVVLGTPFVSSMNAKIVHFLKGSGVEVLADRGLEILENQRIGRLEPQSAYEMAVSLDRPDADAILLACTNWQTLPAIEKAEALLGKPVITTTQASLRAVLQAFGLPTENGPGKLFRMPIHSTAP
jgi:maleate cis-trans isomerase